MVQSGDAASHEHLSELREAHLQELAHAVGLDYRRLVDADALATALLDPRFARSVPVQVDVRWMPALLALLLLAWRFRPGGMQRA